MLPIILSQNEETGFELIARLHPTISHGFRKKGDEFDFNKVCVCRVH